MGCSCKAPPPSTGRPHLQQLAQLVCLLQPRVDAGQHDILHKHTLAAHCLVLSHGLHQALRSKAGEGGARWGAAGQGGQGEAEQEREGAGTDEKHRAKQVRHHTTQHVLH